MLDNQGSPQLGDHYQEEVVVVPVSKTDFSGFQAPEMLVMQTKSSISMSLIDEEVREAPVMVRLRSL